LSRRARTAIFSAVITRTWIGGTFRRGIVGTVTLCLLGTGFPRPGVRAACAQANKRAVSAAAPEAKPADDHFLRDSIPATSFAAAPPDTAGDDFVLPEEKEKKQIAKEIAVWVIAAAFVAFFIIKVFIEKDDEPADDGGNGKPIVPPE